MARKTLDYIVNDEKSRDKGKKFLITEMSAMEAEQWAMRAFFAIMNGGLEIDDDLVSMGLAGLAQIWTKAVGSIPYEAAKPLLDDMMSCVQIQPDPSDASVVRKLMPEDIEEMTTLFKLRKLVLDVHTDFLADAAPSISGASAATQKGSKST